VADLKQKKPRLAPRLLAFTSALGGIGSAGPAFAGLQMQEVHPAKAVCLFLFHLIPSSKLGG
jgi:hypothetical protein